MSANPGPETIKADIEIEGKLRTVALVRVAADADADRPWRIEQPGSHFDGWYMRPDDLRHVQPAA